MTLATTTLRLALVGALLAAGCSGGGRAAKGQYFCPMHPSYVSERPGDCPICNMKLVAADRQQTPAAAAPGKTRHPGHTSATTPVAPGAYICPMCPEVRSQTPGRCPTCGMNLVKETHERQGSGGEMQQPDGVSAQPRPAGPAPLTLGESALRLAGVQWATAEVTRVAPTVRTVGNVAPDETRVRHVHAKLAGWVEKLHVNAVGQSVRRGEPLLDLYSPELVASQEELLRAREAAARLAASSLPEVQRGAAELVEAARRRLALLDVPSAFIEQVERSGRIQRAVTLQAPFAGIVTAKNVVEGHRVEPGEELLTLTDLSTVWVVAEVFEHDAAWVRAGQDVDLSLPYAAMRPVSGRVALLEPAVDAATRTLKLRIELPNPDTAFRPGMFVDVTIRTGAVEGVAVPFSAVLETGTRQVVFVRRGGAVQPREVRVAAREGRTAVLASGLEAGEQVATRASFLLDSEARLQAFLATSPPSPADAVTAQEGSHVH